MVHGAFETFSKLMFWIVFAAIWSIEGFYTSLMFFFFCHVMMWCYSIYLVVWHPVEWKAYWVMKNKEDKEHPRWL
jgi:hypothetical protein